MMTILCVLVSVGLFTCITMGVLVYKYMFQFRFVIYLSVSVRKNFVRFLQLSRKKKMRRQEKMKEKSDTNKKIFF